MSSDSSDPRGDADRPVCPISLDELSPAARRAAYPGAPVRTRMMAAAGLVPMPPRDAVTAQFVLMFDGDADVAEAAKSSLENLEPRISNAVVSNEQMHPAVLDFLAQLFAAQDATVEKILLNPSTPDHSFIGVAEVASEKITEIIGNNQSRLLACPDIVPALAKNANARRATVDRAVAFLGRNGIVLENLPAPPPPPEAPKAAPTVESVQVQCTKCAGAFQIASDAIGDQPLGLRCPFCQQITIVHPPRRAAQVHRPAPGEMQIEFEDGDDGVGAGMDLQLDGPQGAAPGAAWMPSPAVPPSPQAPPRGAVMPGAPPVVMGSGLGDSQAGLELAREEGGFNAPPPRSASSAGRPAAEPQAPVHTACVICGTPLHEAEKQQIGLCQLHLGQPLAKDLAKTNQGTELIKKAITAVDLGDYKGAIQDMKTALLFEPTNIVLKAKLTELELKAKLAPAGPAQGGYVTLAKPEKVEQIKSKSSFGTVLLLMVLLSLLAGGGAAVFYFVAPKQATSMFKDTLGLTPPKPKLDNPLVALAAGWKKETPNVASTIPQELESAKKQQLADTWDGYRAADAALMKALILDPNDPRAVASWVENQALWVGSLLSQKELGLLKMALRYAKNESDHADIYRAQSALSLISGDQGEGPDLNAARGAAEDALRRDAQDARAKLLLAEAFLAGNSSAALSEAEGALEMEPGLKRASTVLARAYANAGRYASARKVLDKRLREAPKNSSSHLVYGAVELELGELASAEKHYKQAASGDGDRFGAQIALGKLYLVDDKHGPARNAFRAVAKSDEAPPRLRAVGYAGWARSELFGKKWALATKLADEALALDPRSAPALLVKAEVALETKSATIAQDLAKRVLSIREQEPAALVVMGRGAMADGRAAEGIKHLEQAVAADPRDPRLDAILAGAYYSMGSSVQAFAVIRHAADTDPLERDTLHRKHLLALSPFALAEALERLRQGTKEEQDRSAAYSAVALLQYQMGDGSGAADSVKRALEADDKNLVALIYDAQIALERRAPDRAKQSAEKLLAEERGAHMGHLMLARAHTAKGARQEAKASFEAALMSQKGFFPAIVGLAQLQLKDNKEAAIKALSEAHVMNPYAIYASRILLETGY